MNVIHSNIKLVKSHSRTPDLEHVCISFTSNVNVHVMGQYKSCVPTVSFHYWTPDGKLAALTMTEAQVIELVMERGAVGK